MTDPLREAAQAVVEAIDGILNAESPYSLTYGDFVPLQRAHDALRAALAAPAPAPVVLRETGPILREDVEDHYRGIPPEGREVL